MSSPAKKSRTFPVARPVKLKAQIERVGMLGVGIMGLAMAVNLMKAGFQVTGYDPDPKAMKRLKAAGGTVHKSAADLAGDAQVIICSLPGPKALHDAAQQIAAVGQRNLLVVETSTLDIADKTTARDTLKAQGIVMLDCPLSAIKQLAPVFEGFSKSTFDLGAFGNGMKMKLMANLLVAIHNVSTAEALLLGQRWGIRPQDAVKVLSDGAGGSRMLQVRGPLMQDEGWLTATMKVGIWQKDMLLIAAAVADAQVPAPLFAATVPIYNAAMALGHAEHDTAAVFDVLSRMSS